ncbi:hypothetical protein [Mycobacterium intracellulare]|uniref:hypothetical protein n=1 Tax=Mycobacterium intracellulare TaxID=1767 RepID=UPI00045317DD|nr:hypothetical protein [Mycobacterium intracellulare]ETZ29719.1 hypothetical protein L843_5473 [Mycobacterium intracellulare MIN_061107_1834]
MSRSRAPTMMLTAIAATVVIVSWVGDATRGRVAAAGAGARHQLVEQPLIGLGAGVTVREIGQDAPFSLVALTGDLAGTSTGCAPDTRRLVGPGIRRVRTAAPTRRGRHPAGVAEGRAARTGLRRHHDHRPDRGDPAARREGDAAARRPD